MDWKIKKTEKKTVLNAYDERHESDNKVIIDQNSMFGHGHQSIHSSKNKISFLDNDLNMIGKEDVEDSKDVSFEDNIKEMKKGPIPGIIISGQHKNLVEKLTEESNEILTIEKEDEEKTEIIKEETSEEEESELENDRDSEIEEVKYDEEFYNELIKIEKTGDYNNLIEHSLSARYNEVKTKGDGLVLPTVRSLLDKIKTDEKKYDKF